MPPLSSAGKEEEGEVPVSPGGGVFGSPARLELEEDEGATLAPADVETEAGPLAEPEEAGA
jgi:hypothetical protein